MILRLIRHCFVGFTLFSKFSAEAGQLDLTGPAGSGSFGVIVTALPNGNFIVTDPGYDAPGPIADVGAVYLYDGATLNVISVLTGSTANDKIGIAEGIDGITVLPNGNFVVRSGNWNGSRGAATWVSGTSGISGAVSSSNSLVGSTANDQVGNGGITALPNGNYVVLSSNWHHGGTANEGAVTWGSGTSGVSGEVASTNSLVGSTANDLSGNASITVLPNGNYVVRIPQWDHGATADVGAVTWGSGTSGISGAVSSSNSLVGSAAGDRVGSSGISVVYNSNFVVGSYFWNESRGAATWGSGTSGVSGAVSSSNSLVGSTVDDRVGSNSIYVQPNGNYVVVSNNWDNGAKVNAGAVTWGSGATGVVGAVSSSNSLVGSTADDQVGSRGISGLLNGNYVVLSPDWDNGSIANVGAATWGSGTGGVSGAVSSSNSLVGSAASDRVGSSGISVLNGNYVVRSFHWNMSRGAVTWGNGTSGISGVVTSNNSLVGSTPNDSIGSSISVLTNGNYVVASFSWNGNRGAATWGSGTGGISGAVSPSNSLVGSTANDRVGISGVAVLSSGSYVVRSPNWSNGANANAGAATWGSGTGGVSGAVSPSNSLVGSTANDRVGDSIYAYSLPNGNYVLRSYDWNGKRGAVTWGSGTGGVSGVVSASNSLVGTTANDRVGSGGVSVLPNQNYVVSSPDWDNGATVNVGAVTWGRGTSGVSGVVSSSNSLVGITAYDRVGGSGIYGQPDGNYLVLSSSWDNGANVNAGAVSLGEGAAGTTGEVAPVNSFPGMAASGGESMTFSYDMTNSRVVVGYPAANQVSLFDHSPEIWVSGHAQTIADGDVVPSSSDHTDFGGATAGGGSVVRTFTISNAGMEPLNLTGSPRVAVSGTQAADFTVTLLPGAAVGSAASTTFQVTFAPGGTGLRTATLGIANNDSNESPYEFAVQCIGQTEIENWRSTYFGGATENVGNLEDFDADGVNNLFEFAFGTIPSSQDSGGLPLQYAGSFAGGGVIVSTGQPVTQFASLPDSMDFRVLFVRRKDYAAAGLTYTVQFSADLGAWQNSTAQPAVLADDGIHQIVSVPYSSFIAERRAGFFKITVALE